MREWKWIGFVLLLLLGCIGVRSLIGFSLVMPWKSVLALALTLTLAVTLGKALGGVLADRWGVGPHLGGRIGVGSTIIGLWGALSGRVNYGPFPF